MKFETTLFQMGNNTGIEVPPEVVEELGGGKRAAVTVDVNGFVYTSTLAVMGGRQLIPPSTRKAHAASVAEAKAPETRARRIAKIVAALT